jgi:hypothetical protein
MTSRPIRLTFNLMGKVKPVEHSVAEAVKQLKKYENVYELTNNDYAGEGDAAFAKVGLNRIYGDIDLYVADEQTMKRLDRIFEATLTEGFQKTSAALMSASGKTYDGKYKVSWRFVLTAFAAQKCVMESYLSDYVVDSLQEIYKAQGGDVAWSLDTSVYSANRKMRCCRSKKDIPGGALEDRPMRLIKGSYEDTLICYIPEGIQILPMREQLKLCKDRSTKLLAEGECMSDKDWKFMNELVELIPLSILDNRKTWVDFVFACWHEEKTERMEELINKISARSQGYSGTKSIRDLIKSFKPTEKPKTKGTLIYWADTYNRKDWLALKKAHPQELYKQLFTKDLRPANTETYDSRFVKPLPITEYDTLIVEAKLGTGKTVQIIGSTALGVPGILNYFKRILFISGRKSFTAFALAETAKENILFENYATTKLKLSTVDRLFIQVESLHRLADGYADYDLVVVDESETIAHQFYSVATHKDNMIANHYIFKKVMRGASKVVAADAFVSDRTFSFLRHLRRNTWAERSIYILNSHQPYKRNAYELLSCEKDVRVPNEGLFIERIMTALTEKKRIAIVWTSKRKGAAFMKDYLEPLMAQGLKVKFYNGDSGKALRSELKDVNKHWSAEECDVLMYTTSITVGISYDPKEIKQQYDELFLWACCGSATPRDIAQALLRCRTIKSNKLTYVCDLRGITPSIVGLEQVRSALKDKKERLRNDHPVVGWLEAPEWADDNYVFNENEVRVSRSEYRTVLKHYLSWCGYTIYTQGGKAPHKLTNADGEDFDDIENINEEAAADIRRRKMTDDTEPEEILQLKKFTFMKALMYSDKAEAKTLWNTWLESPKKESAFWNTVHEKHSLLAETVVKESQSRYLVMAKREVEQRNALSKILKLLGMKHSQESKTLTHAEFSELLPAAKAMETEVRRVFGLKLRRANKSEFDCGDFHDMLRSVWGAWCDGKVETINAKKLRNGTKRTNVYDYCFTPTGLWDNISERLEEEGMLPDCMIVDEPPLNTIE